MNHFKFLFVDKTLWIKSVWDLFVPQSALTIHALGSASMLAIYVFFKYFYIDSLQNQAHI